MLKDVLLVDPDHAVLRMLEQVLSTYAHVDLCHDFEGARRRLTTAAPDLFVANIRLRDYNALHLVYIARTLGLRTRAIVYGEPGDLVLASEAQAAGAFYVRGAHLLTAVPAYIRAELPLRDRRDPTAPDRRRTFRGGRRASDRTAEQPLFS